MGVFANLVTGKDGSVRDAIAAGRESWNRVFGARTDKERDFPQVRPTPGGSWTRGVVSEPAAIKRLLQAMRSMAPGGWSDDRWEQQKHYTGLPYVAISHKARLMSEAEFQVFERDDNHQDGKRPVRKGHPGYDLVKVLEKPNPDDSFGDWCADQVIQLDLTGIGLTWKVPNQFGVPYELYSIPTAIAIPQPAINPDYPDGYYRIQPIYPYGPFSSYPTPTTAVGAPIPAQWMLRLRYRHPLLRYDGYSPLTGMRFQLDELEMMDKSRFYSMKKSFNPSAVLNPAAGEGASEGLENLPEPEIERIRAEMEADHQGVENHGRLFVAARGWKMEEFGATPKEMDYPNSWDQLVDFDMLAFGMTKAGIGMSDSGSYSEAFARVKQLHLMTLSPICQMLGQKLTRDVAKYFGEDLIVEVKAKRIDDHEVTFAKIEKLMTTKAGTVNEVRRMLDMPMLPEDKFDWANERLGEQPEQEGMPGMPGAEGMPGQEAGQAPGANPAAPGPEGEAEQEEEGPDHESTYQAGLAILGEPPHAEPSAEKERPKVGAGSRGSLGPRKSLARKPEESYSERIRRGIKSGMREVRMGQLRALGYKVGSNGTNGRHR